MSVWAWIQAAAQAPTAPDVAQASAELQSSAQPIASSEALPQASSFAASVDGSLLVILWFAIFLSILVAGCFALIALMRRNGAIAASSRAVPIWTALSACVLVAFFFVHGARVWADMQVIPRGALPIRVALEEQGFTFTYPNGQAQKELHLPLDRAVKLTFLGSTEPYGFAIPAFRLQVSVPAGTRKEAWVLPTVAGEYEARSHVDTLRPQGAPTADAVVHAEGAYEKWYQDISGPPLDLPPLELGQRSYQMRGCTQCHTIDGNKLVGPSFKGFSSREHRLVDGTVVAPTAEYIRESLLEPQAKVLEGFEPVMPSFKGRLHELELAGLAAYIQSLQ